MLPSTYSSAETGCAKNMKRTHGQRSRLSEKLKWGIITRSGFRLTMHGRTYGITTTKSATASSYGCLQHGDVGETVTRLCLLTRMRARMKHIPPEQDAAVEGNCIKISGNPELLLD